MRDNHGGAKLSHKITAVALAALLAIGVIGVAATSADARVESSGVATVSIPTAKKGTALYAAERLTVKGRAAKTGYARAKFGSGWVDVNSNKCDTRNDILARDMTKVKKSGKCKVTAGTLKEPYTGKTVKFKPGSGTNVQIDHVVALSDAWQKGAQKWVWAKRVAFANDPLNLLAVDAKANMSKGDGDTATWLPKNKAYRCNFVARQVTVKQKYGVWVTKAEKAAMVKVLKTCPSKKLLSYGKQPVNAKNPGKEPKTAAPKVPAKPKKGTDPRFDTCAAAKKAGYGPYKKGTTEYTWYRDGDKDGWVCE